MLFILIPAFLLIALIASGLIGPILALILSFIMYLFGLLMELKDDHPLIFWALVIALLLLVAKLNMLEQ